MKFWLFLTPLACFENKKQTKPGFFWLFFTQKGLALA